MGLKSETFFYHVEYMKMMHCSRYERKLLNSNDREEILRWLSWNDRNGFYTDQQMDSEGWPRISLQDAKKLMREVIDENR